MSKVASVAFAGATHFARILHFHNLGSTKYVQYYYCKKFDGFPHYGRWITGCEVVDSVIPHYMPKRVRGLFSSSWGSLEREVCILIGSLYPLDAHILGVQLSGGPDILVHL
jgi:hypothetical protein